jgi:hypothetical protein
MYDEDEDDYYDDEDVMIMDTPDWREDFDEFFDGEESECANVAVLTKTGGLGCIANTACHAGLSGMSHLKNKIQMIISRPTNENPYEEGDLITFADWMVNESPWKDVFLNPNGKHVLNNYWWVSPDHNAEFVVNACIATRLISEFPERFDTFKNGLSAGLSGTEAYLAACLFSGEDSLYFYPARSHSIANYSSSESITRFLTHSPHFYRPETYQEVGNYRHNQSVWDGGDVNTDWGVLHQGVKIIERFKPGEVLKVKNLNIFYKEKMDNNANYFQPKHLPNIMQQIKEKFIA